MVLLLFTLYRDKDDCIWIKSRKFTFSVGCTDTIKHSNTDLDVIFHSLLGEGHITRACKRGKVLKEKNRKLDHCK